MCKNSKVQTNKFQYVELFAPSMFPSFRGAERRGNLPIHCVFLSDKLMNGAGDYRGGVMAHFVMTS